MLIDPKLQSDFNSILFSSDPAGFQTAKSRMITDIQSAMLSIDAEGLRRMPGDEELLVFLALALQEAKRANDSRRVLQAIVDRPGESSAPRRLAFALLNPSDEGLPIPMNPPDPRARGQRSI